MQSFWSISTSLASAATGTSLAPLETWTQTFSSLPFLTRTSGLVIGFLAQNGSASRCSLAAVGGLPLKSTEPSIEPAANAAQGNSAAHIAAIAALFGLFMLFFSSEV